MRMAIGYLGLAVGVDDVAHRRLEANRNQAQGQGLEILPGNIVNLGLEGQKVKEGRQQEIACYKDKGRKGRLR